MVCASRQISSKGGAPLRASQVAGRDITVTSHLLELFERGLLSNLLVGHEGCGYKVPRVIRLTNMGEMN